MGVVFVAFRGVRVSSTLYPQENIELINIYSYHLNSNSSDVPYDKQKMKKELKDSKAILNCAREFGLVGDPTRMKICWLLCKRRELSVGEIAEIIGVSISAISHTLKKLKKANMVESRREFRTVYYKLKKSPVVKVIKERISHYAKI